MITSPLASSLNAVHRYVEKKLVAQIQRKPHERAARLQLLDLYFETGRKDDFVRHAGLLYAGLGDRAAASPEWQRCASMGGILGCIPAIRALGTALVATPVLSRRA